MKNEIYEPADLDRLEGDLNKLPDALTDAVEHYANDIFAEYYNVASEHVVTGEMLRAMFITNAKDFVLIENDTVQAFVLEGGRDDRPNYPAHHHAEKTLAKLDADDSIEKHITKQFDKILK
jgi:hypothetical protein